MSNIFDFIYRNNNIKSGKDFFKLPVLDLPHDFLRFFLLDWYEEVNKYFTQSSQEKNLDTIYDYFFLLESKKMKNYIHNIKDNESKKKFENILESIENHLSKYKIPEIEEICLCNLDQLLSDKKNYWLKEQFFWFFFNSKFANIFFKKIKDDEYYQKFIIANFSQIKNIFMQHLNWCVDFFNFEKLKKYLNNGEVIGNWFLDFIINFKDHKHKTIKENYDLFENRLKNYLDVYHKKIENIDDSEWMENAYILGNILNYFIKIKSPNKGKYANIRNSISKWKDKYLEKYGTKVSSNLSQQNQKMICDAYSNIEQDWYAKILGLTHHKKNDKKFISFFEEIGGDEKNIIDMICDDEEYFFASKMDHLNIHIKYCVWILRKFYLSTKKNDIFFGMLTGLLKECIKLIKDNFNQFSYNDEIKMLLLKDWISEDISKIMDNKQYSDQKLNFSSSISMVLLIEKFLEILYLCKYPKDKSLPRWYLTLSLLLAKESPIGEIFGKNAIKIIKYILSDSRGLNIRNKLMHFDLNFKIQETINFDNTMLLLYVLLLILNSWILFMKVK